MKPEALLVLCTVESREEGVTIARKLISERLAACVNLLPSMTSFYMYEGAMHESSEYQLIIKSTPSLFEALRHRIKTLHSYEIPEIIALDITHADPAYLAWMHDNLEVSEEL